MTVESVDDEKQKIKAPNRRRKAASCSPVPVQYAALTFVKTPTSPTKRRRHAPNSSPPMPNCPSPPPLNSPPPSPKPSPPAVCSPSVDKE